MVATLDFGHGDCVVDVDPLPQDWKEAKREVDRRIKAHEQRAPAIRETPRGKKEP